MVQHFEHFIGIDIGGTSTKFGVVRSDGVIADQGTLSTCETEDPKHFVERLYGLLRPMIESVGGARAIDGVGIGAPNANFYSRNIEHAPNLKWRGIVPMAALIEDRLQAPTFITNDANAAALGEMKFGAAREMTNFIAITLGTGLGSGFVVNGKMLYGHSGSAGEYGHVTVVRDGRQCGCGRRGCLEAYVSATGIVVTMLERLSHSNRASRLRNWPHDLTARAITEAAVAGDELATEVLQETGQILGEKLADVVTVTSPQAIFLMGGLAQAGEFLFAPTRMHFKRNLLNIFQTTVEILPSNLPEYSAAILGAAALAWAEH